jgi:hypothetical protein
LKSTSTLRALTDRNTLLHLRVPFSYYLFPVFLFGISQAITIDTLNLVIVLVAQHLFIYPGSNIYNSYMDQDTGSIGGLEHPPPVTKEMYYVSMIFDVTGLLICSYTGWENVLVMCGYIAFSKAYSWHGIRLKKYPYLGWFAVMFFQGGYTFMQGNMAATGIHGTDWFTPKNLECMLFASLIIGGSYPLTQIYQHGEDSERGDFTISYRLGIIGTFIFTASFFAIGSAVLLHYLTTYYSINDFFVFLICLTPVLVYFTSWFIAVNKDRINADYRRSMLMNKVSATSMIVFFIVFILMHR